MRILITTDLHINTRPDDSYRWEFILGGLPKLIKKHAADELYILGDLTHDKDRHSSLLVNGLLEALEKLAELVPVTILKGNHDYVDPRLPFMQFVNKFRADILFVVEPYTDSIAPYGGKRVMFLPHTKEPLKDWKNIKMDSNYIFMHHTINGSVVSNGMRLSTEVTSAMFKDCGRAFSGDVHVPQRIGKVLYVGTPYHVHFGDSFNPRLVLLDTETDKLRSIPYDECPRKISIRIRDPKELQDSKYIRPGDYVKVRIELTKSDFYRWKIITVAIKEQLEKLGAKERGIEIKEIKRVRLLRNLEHKTKRPSHLSVSDYDVLARYSGVEGIDSELFEFGSDLL